MAPRPKADQSCVGRRTPFRHDSRADVIVCPRTYGTMARPTAFWLNLLAVAVAVAMFVLRRRDQQRAESQQEPQAATS